MVKEKLQKSLSEKLDRLQFAYQPGKSTEDLILTMMHYTLKHLDKSSKNSVRCLMLDFSSAFNTIKHSLLVEKLINFQVPSRLCLWVLNFLRDRGQYVRLGDIKSDIISINRGSPQGCVLSPLLFTAYTNEMTATRTKQTYVFKFADDTAVLGLIENEDLTEYKQCIDKCTHFCERNKLLLNESKTKEIIFESKGSTATGNIEINNKTIDIVPRAKYLGVILDNKLLFEEHIKEVSKKAAKRLFLVKKINYIMKNKKIVSAAYKAFVQPLLMYCSTVMNRAITQKDNKKLQACNRYAIRRGWIDQKSLENTQKKVFDNLVTKIVRDKEHPLHQEFKKLPSGRRFNIPYCRTTRFKKSFVPHSLMQLNSID